MYFEKALKRVYPNGELASHVIGFIGKNSEGKEVLINQVGCFGVNLGRIDFYLTNDKLYHNQTKNIIV